MTRRRIVELSRPRSLLSKTGVFARLHVAPALRILYRDHGRFIRLWTIWIDLYRYYVLSLQLLIFQVTLRDARPFGWRD
ncbi:hypothetical protein BDW67DRAFT_167096 [Aspergillus spinulosporus]